MIKLFRNFKINVKQEHINFPEAKSVQPIVYIALFISVLIGLIGTFYHYTLNSIRQISESTIIKNKADSKLAYEAPEKTYQIILKRNIFNFAGTLPDAFDESEIVCSVQPKKSSLGYKVTGILYGGNSKGSLAILEREGGGDPSIYKVGDTVIPGITISDFSKDRVFIVGKKCPEYLEIEFPKIPQQRRSDDKSGKNFAVAENGLERVGNTTTVTKQYVNDILTNKLSTVLEDARAIPFMAGGQVKGFTITQIIPDSIYEKLGLKNGDVVSTINGIELNDAARAIQTLNSLRSENKINLEVVRNGQPVNLKVQVQ